MNLFCTMLVNNTYMVIFPASFTFFFWQNIKWLQSFLSERKSFARRTRKHSFFPQPSSSLDQIVLWSCFGLTKGAVCCVNWLIQIYWENLYSQKQRSHQIASESKISGDYLRACCVSQRWASWFYNLFAQLFWRWEIGNPTGRYSLD